MLQQYSCSIELWISNTSLYAGIKQVQPDIRSTMEIVRALVIQSAIEYTSLTEARNWLQNNSLFHSQTLWFEDVILNKLHFEQTIIFNKFKHKKKNISSTHD